ncbi:MAG: uncharacterized protein PWR09_534 [Archaeoglobi archaeon]|nr:NAD(P)/FAD-dependent oxidoreductase [Candidatus Mnemosynella bozhongmuii]MDI3502409.1 uncharacterized protein [Archaeoglobi archaeon]
MKRVVIVGAGPAGLFCAYELSKSEKFQITIIEAGKRIEERRCPVKEGKKCVHCKLCDVVHGVGGAGGMSDGKLNLHPSIGGDLLEFMDEQRAWELIKMVDEIFLRHGAPGEIYLGDSEELRRRAAAASIEFIPVRQRHVGSDLLVDVIRSIEMELEKRGVRILTEKRVLDVELRGSEKIVTLDDGSKISSDFLVLAPGRKGSQWLMRIAEKLGISYRFMPIDVGVRVEIPAVIYDELTSISWDPKFRMRTPTYDDLVRTFCTCPNGFVVIDTYDAGVGVNGHSLRSMRSENTNFAFLVTVQLTEPVENTTEYGNSIAQLSMTIGGGKPIIQRLGDLIEGRRSTWERIQRSFVKPTLRDVTPGDISMALPHRIVQDIIEGLEMLDRVVPGVASSSTLLYAPEIKFSAIRMEVREGFETSISGLFTIGDGAGVSRDIVNSAVTGIVAAQRIAELSE